MKNIISEITQQEKNRILEMHKRATSNQYLMEETISVTSEPLESRYYRIDFDYEPRKNTIMISGIRKNEDGTAEALVSASETPDKVSNLKNKFIQSNRVQLQGNTEMSNGIDQKINELMEKLTPITVQPLESRYYRIDFDYEPRKNTIMISGIRKNEDGTGEALVSASETPLNIAKLKDKFIQSNRVQLQGNEEMSNGLDQKLNELISKLK